MKKREFLKSASSLSVLSVLGISLESCNDEDEPAPVNNALIVDITEASFAALLNDGEWVLHPNRNYLLVNVKGNIRAFSSRCTHRGCARDWSFNTNATCTCHTSVFNVEGDVVSGPASRSLTLVNVTRDGNILTIG